MHQICKGISSSSSLEHLDLRRNIFDEKGLEDLLEALKAHMCIKNIIMEGTQIGMKEAQMLAHFFERPDCKIEEFVMKEAEVEADALMQIMEAFFKTNQMRKLNLSKNSLSPQICSILSKVSIKLNHFTSLVLSYCDIDEEGLS
jgi:Ran GTPase-activating protein (RanGAP) involved in mRNA processing and transport